MRVRSVVTVVVGAVAALSLATAAWATKPVTTPYNPPPTVLEPGQACAFNVTIESLPGGTWTETVYPDGSIVYQGKGRDRATNTDVGKSATVKTEGRLRYTPIADGSTRLKASGLTLFYFWAGDQGPYGEVGEDGALYYIDGTVEEILDSDFVVTYFRWTGRAKEICSRID
jgi:hypothetical protein